MPLTLPIAIPYAAERFAHRGHPWAGSVYSFGVIKLTTVQIAQREMRKVEIFHIPRGGLRRIAVDSLPKKSQFESEPTFFRQGINRDPAKDRKSTRLNSSHDQISYAVFCL